MPEKRQTTKLRGPGPHTLGFAENIKIHMTEDPEQVAFEMDVRQPPSQGTKAVVVYAHRDIAMGLLRILEEAKKTFGIDAPLGSVLIMREKPKKDHLT